MRDMTICVFSPGSMGGLCSIGISVPFRTNISRCLALMAVSKRLERIADHATNIAEEVVYLYEARDIRHASLKVNEA